MRMQILCRKIFNFYRDGFVGMRLGRTLWLIILLKLFILFGIVKPFFFPDILQTRFQSNDARAAFVFGQFSAASYSANRPSVETGQVGRTSLRRGREAAGR